MLSLKTRVFASVAMLFVPFAVLAQGNDPAERAGQAQSACLAGDYAKGVAILADLYVSTRNAIYIFNQGRCFEQNGKYEEAILRFREFERKRASEGHASDPAAREHIADCQALLDKQKSAGSAALDPSAATEVSGRSAPASTDSEPVSGAAPAGIDTNRANLSQATPAVTQDQAEGSVFRSWWFWTAVGAVVVGGLTTALLLSRGSGSSLTCTDCVDRAEVNQ